MISLIREFLAYLWFWKMEARHVYPRRIAGRLNLDTVAYKPRVRGEIKLSGKAPKKENKL